MNILLSCPSRFSLVSKNLKKLGGIESLNLELAKTLSKENINVNLKIKNNEYSRIITSNFIHESASLLELLNYLNLANKEKGDFMSLFLNKYKENANKIFKDVNCSLSHGRKFNSRHYVDKIVNYDS